MSLMNGLKTSDDLGLKEREVAGIDKIEDGVVMAIRKGKEGIPVDEKEKLSWLIKSWKNSLSS